MFSVKWGRLVFVVFVGRILVIMFLCIMILVVLRFFFGFGSFVFVVVSGMVVLVSI